MPSRFALLALLISTGAAAQPEASVEVRAALEAQLPLPSKPLALPDRVPSHPTGARSQALESARARAAEAGRRGRGLAIGHLPGEEPGQSAKGQARAEEVRKNARGKGRPPKP